MLKNLLRELATLAALLTDGDEPPTLIGGMAVALRTGALEAPDFPDGPLLDPHALARTPRVTVDLDLVVGRYVEHRERLLREGFVVDRRELVRLRRDGLIVDLLPQEPTPDILHVPPELCHGDLIQVVGHEVSVRVPGPAALLILKARAWNSRYAERDLTDIASLAFATFASHEETRWQLASLSEGVPGCPRMLAAVADAFRNRDARGPGAFFEAVRAAAGISAFEEDTCEGEVRGMASDLVLGLLRDFRR